MNTKKLWIWSIAFAFCGTVIFYLVLNADEKLPAGSETTNNTIEVDDNKEVSDQTNVDSSKDDTKEKEEIVEENDPSVNKLLPISKGKRAITIQVGDFQGVSGFLKPGSYVDVVAKLIVPEDAKEGQHNAATTVLQNVQILAIGHAADDPETRKRYQLVTLEVSSKEGLALGLATKYELYLMLRADGDNQKEPHHIHIHEDELHKGVFVK